MMRRTRFTEVDSATDMVEAFFAAGTVSSLGGEECDSSVSRLRRTAGPESAAPVDVRPADGLLCDERACCVVGATPSDARERFLVRVRAPSADSAGASADADFAPCGRSADPRPPEPPCPAGLPAGALP
ncbi:MAG: hypothetical protein P8J30_05745 [Ilumatobacter sp.]|nr:hypothetical protein [Ilumatobacter sp.]